MLYQLSYRGALCEATRKGSASGWKRAYGEARRAWQGGNPSPRASASSVVAIGVILRDFLGEGGAARNGVTVAEPLREIAVAAPARAKRRKFRSPRSLADRTATGRFIHAERSGHAALRSQARDRFRCVQGAPSGVQVPRAIQACTSP